MTKLSDVMGKGLTAKLENMTADKHSGSIAVINYKGGVGKTTVSCLLGYYLAEETRKKVLLKRIWAVVAEE